MMTASCAGAKGESSVLLGQDEPEWAQDIVLPVEIPSRDPREVLRWLGKQMLVVAMYDYQAYGVVPHLEWLASVKKPLVALVGESISGGPVLHRLALESLPPHRSPSHAEVAVTIPAGLLNLWHAYGGCADDFYEQNEGRVRRDLGQGLRTADSADAASDGGGVGGGGSGSEGGEGKQHPQQLLGGEAKQSPEASGAVRRESRFAQPAADLSVFRRWHEFRTDATRRFPRRHVQVVAKDEYGTFVLLPRLVRPPV